MTKSKRFLALLLMLIILFCASAKVFAVSGKIDPERESSLEIIFREGDKNLSDAEFSVYLIANITFSSDRVFFMKFNMGLGESTISAVLLMITIASVATVPFISKLATKFEKKTVFAQVIGTCGVIMIVTRFIGVDSFPMLIFVCILYAIANACYWQLMPSMIYDVCEVEELISGEKHSGAVISLQALSESLSVAAGVQMLGIILEMAGFNNEAAVQTELALTWVENSFVVIPGLAMVAVAVIMKFYPMTKDVFDRVKAALEKRENGEEIDLSEFREFF